MDGRCDADGVCRLHGLAGDWLVATMAVLCCCVPLQAKSDIIMDEELISQLERTKTLSNDLTKKSEEIAIASKAIQEFCEQCVGEPLVCCVAKVACVRVCWWWHFLLVLPGAVQARKQAFKCVEKW